MKAKHLIPVLAVATLAAWTIQSTSADSSSGSVGVWTTVASTCSVRPGDEGRTKFGGSKVKFKGSNTGSVCLHYSAVEPDDWDGLGGANVRVRFRDNGNSARVRLYLHVINVFTSQEDVHLFFDSDAYSANNDVRTKTVGVCFSQYPESTTYLFWVEARLDRESASGKPELHWIHATETYCN
jgi:hypothetical protein